MNMLPIFRETEPRHSRQRGMSLVEVMVASVVGMLTVLAVTQTMSFSETQRRATTGSGDVQSNVALATYLLEREARMAGYGVFANDVNFINQCMRGSVLAYNSERNQVDIAFTPATVPFVPVVINPPGIPAGDAGSDVLGVAFSTSGIGLAGIGARIGLDSGTGVTVANAAGFVAGDLGLAVSANAGAACSIYEITDGPGAVHCSGAGASAALQYGQANYQSQHHGCASIAPTRNKPGGMGVNTAVYNDTGRLFNLGRREGLTYAFYAVRGGRLVRCDHYRSNCSDNAALNNEQVWTPVSDGVVVLRAEFGVSTSAPPDPNAAVAAWRTTVCDGADCNPTRDDWNNLRVLRLALVGRSQQPAGAGTTTAAPTWGGQTAIDLSGLANWGSFRYVKTEVVIPLRNIMWGSTS